MIRKAIIPTELHEARFLSAELNETKNAHHSGNQSSIHCLIDEAVQSGIQEIIIVTGNCKSEFKEQLPQTLLSKMLPNSTDNNYLLYMVKTAQEMPNIHFVSTKEPFHLSNAILSARAFIGNEPFAILLGDLFLENSSPAISQMIRCYEQVESSILGCMEIHPQEVNKHEIIEYSFRYKDMYKVQRVVDKPTIIDAPSTQAIFGRYIFTPTIFDMIEKTISDHDGKIPLTAAMDRLLCREPVFSYLIEGEA